MPCHASQPSSCHARCLPGSVNTGRGSCCSSQSGALDHTRGAEHRPTAARADPRLLQLGCPSACKSSSCHQVPVPWHRLCSLRVLHLGVQHLVLQPHYRLCRSQLSESHVFAPPTNTSATPTASSVLALHPPTSTIATPLAPSWHDQESPACDALYPPTDMPAPACTCTSTSTTTTSAGNYTQSHLQKPHALLPPAPHSSRCPPSPACPHTGVPRCITTPSTHACPPFTHRGATLHHYT